MKGPRNNVFTLAIVLASIQLVSVVTGWAAAPCCSNNYNSKGSLANKNKFDLGKNSIPRQRATAKSELFYDDVRVAAKSTKLSATAVSTGQDPQQEEELSTQTKYHEDANVQNLQVAFDKINQLARVKHANASTPLLAYVDRPDKPTYRRLFTHETWNLHLGGSVRARWIKCLSTLPDSVILQSVGKMTLVLTTYAGIVAYAVAAITNQNSPLPRALRLLCAPFFQTAIRAAKGSSGAHQLALTFCGTAIGLLLVFRTNNAYQRLEEARNAWGSIVGTCREILSKCTTFGPLPLSATSQVCRYLAAYCWALRDVLKDGETRCDILNILLSKQDKAMISSSENYRSRPMAIHLLLRKYLHSKIRPRQLLRTDEKDGLISESEHYLLEMDLNKLSTLSTDCERLFTSPIPPTMSRHGLRCLTLFLAALPPVLAASGMTPLANIFWTFGISFIYLGIDELGIQVEQPFQIIPLWQLCQMLQTDMEELVQMQAATCIGTPTTKEGDKHWYK